MGFLKKARKWGKRIAHDPLKVAAYALAPVTFGASVGAYEVGHKITSSMAKKRQAQHKDEAALAEQKAQMEALGTEEMGKYDTGFITEGQQANIDKTKSTMSAQLKQAMGEAGISDSTMMEAGKGSIEQVGVSMKEQIRDQHWTNAMKAFGMEADAINQMHQMNKANMDMNIQMFTGLMNVLGGATALLIGGSDTTGGGEGGVISDDISSGGVYNA